MAVSTESDPTSSTENCLIQAGFSRAYCTSTPPHLAPAYFLRTQTHSYYLLQSDHPALRVISTPTTLLPTSMLRPSPSRCLRRPMWVDYWLVPFLNDTNFNDTRSAVPENACSTVDSTYYMHYSSLSTVAANWGLGSLGCGDPNKTGLSRMSNPSANATGYADLDIALADIPLTNITDMIPGLLNVQYHVPITAPLMSAAPALANPTAQGKTVPWLDPRVAAASSNSSSGSADGAAGAREGMVGATVPGALLAGVAALLLARVDHAVRATRERCWFAGLASI
ncbi:hypothetical protein EDB83DRAFT_2675443 [Lactarius deliciosus]|nr:hypothetical protein EDB83DRAFT_2675443 [Lactarius deliciosus]